MTIPMIDFDSCNGLQDQSTDFFTPATGVVMTCDPGAASPPDIVVYHNFLDQPVELAVVDAVSLFRDAPDEIVEALFVKQFYDSNNNLYAMASHCLDTGGTIFRGYSTSGYTTDRAEAVLEYLSAKALDYMSNITLHGGESVAVCNRQQMVFFPETCNIERRYIYTDGMGDDFPQHMENSRG